MFWNEIFEEMFERRVADYKAGNFDCEKDYTAEELAFLKSIGYKEREFFDFVEDFVDQGVPSRSTALLVAAVRRDYFLVEQEGRLSDKEILRDELPPKPEKLAGFEYLPRILRKARAKLRGELDPDIMYGCGGDRRFLSENGEIPAADFLRRVWAAGDDDEKIIEWLKSM